MSSIGQILDDQYTRMWNLLREVILNTPDEPWREGSRISSGLARLAYHTIETVDFYNGETEKSFKWGARLGINIWEAATPSELPSKEQVNKYAEEVRIKTETIFSEWNDMNFMAKQTIFHWTGKTLLDRFLYIIKHSYYHLGQINAVLSASGFTPLNWR